MSPISDSRNLLFLHQMTWSPCGLFGEEMSTPVDPYTPASMKISTATADTRAISESEHCDNKTINKIECGQ